MFEWQKDRMIFGFFNNTWCYVLKVQSYRKNWVKIMHWYIRKICNKGKVREPKLCWWLIHYSKWSLFSVLALFLNVLHLIKYAETWCCYWAWLNFLSGPLSTGFHPGQANYNFISFLLFVCPQGDPGQKVGKSANAFYCLYECIPWEAGGHGQVRIQAKIWLQQ